MICCKNYFVFLIFASLAVRKNILTAEISRFTVYEECIVKGLVWLVISSISVGHLYILYMIIAHTWLDIVED